MDHVEAWIEGSGYSARLGVQLETLETEKARLVLPFREENTNPGKVLHGGVAASLVDVGGLAITRAVLGEEAAPFHTSVIQVTYLAAARNEAIFADATLLRRGKELCFVDVAVHTEAGKSIARGLVSARGRFSAAQSATPETAGDDGASNPGRLGPHIEKVPFMARLGLRIEHMMDGRSRIVMPWSEANADASGGVHEGAVLALLDTTGAMASWAVTGAGPYKASTPALQAQFVTDPPHGDLIGYGRNVHRDGDAFWSDVEVANAESGRVVARGTVLYRIVVPS